MRGRSIIFSLFIAFCLSQTVAGLKCYSCVQSGSEDRKCEKDPKLIQNSAINCNKKYCVIRRIEYIDQSGVVFSFYRGCEQRPDYINTEITDSQFKTYYRSCTTDLCNSGNGISSGGGGSGGGPINSGDGDDDGAIMVPGLNTASIRAGCSVLLLAVSALIRVTL